MRDVTGGSAPLAIWRGFMDAALPRLAVQKIPDGPAMPEGWQAPDPVGDLMGGLEDPYGGTVVDPVDPNIGEPYLDESPNGGPVIIRPTTPQPDRYDLGDAPPPRSDPRDDPRNDPRNDPRDGPRFDPRYQIPAPPRPEPTAGRSAVLLDLAGRSDGDLNHVAALMPT